MNLTDKKLWASLSLDVLKEVITKFPHKVKNSEKFGKQVTLQAKQWDDGTISLSWWDAESGERFNIGRVMISKDQNNSAPAAAPAAFDDAPF